MTSKRRPLVQGLVSTDKMNDPVEKEFVYGNKDASPSDSATNNSSSLEPPSSAVNHSRSPISTRIRSDVAAALKRASLERQLAGSAPHTLQDILEQAIELWLRSNNHLN